MEGWASRYLTLKLRKKYRVYRNCDSNHLTKRVPEGIIRTEGLVMVSKMSGDPSFEGYRNGALIGVTPVKFSLE